MAKDTFVTQFTTPTNVKPFFVFGPSDIQITSLQSQISSKETDLRSQEDELSHTKANLSQLQEEEAHLEQSLLSARVQLDSIIKSLKTTQEEINQVSEDNQRSGCITLFFHVYPLSCLLDVVSRGKRDCEIRKMYYN